jgi:hypothetical protein
VLVHRGGVGFCRTLRTWRDGQLSSDKEASGIGSVSAQSASLLSLSCTDAIAFPRGPMFV